MDKLFLEVTAVVWMFGALVLWPIARAGSNARLLSERLLRWTFLIQLALQLVWGVWLAILWWRGVSHIEDGLLPLYIIGTLGWVIAALTFLYWLVERRKLHSET